MATIKEKSNRTNIVTDDQMKKQSSFIMIRLNIKSFSALIRYLIAKEYNSLNK